MEEFERAQLLERIDREGATIGADIPDRIEIQGEELDLRSFVFEMRRRETIPAGERDRVEQAKRNLRRERRERRDLIEAGEISFEEGERLAGAIIGISRALEGLENLDATGVEADAQATEAADQKRWMQFLKKALGREGKDSRGVRGSPRRSRR